MLFLLGSSQIVPPLFLFLEDPVFLDHFLTGAAGTAHAQH